MKKKLMIACLITCSLQVGAQNCQVPTINGGFESFEGAGPTCNQIPNSYNVGITVGWESIRTADVFSSTQPAGPTGPCIYYRKIHSGTYAAGFDMWSGNREFIYRNLGSLVNGAKYKVKAYFKATGVNPPSQGVGVWITSGTTVTESMLNSSPQLASPVWTTHTIGNDVWNVYEASFTAGIGNYMFTIGSSQTSSSSVYVCVDDVSITFSTPTAAGYTSATPVCQPTCVNFGVMVFGGSSPYTFSWTNGSTSPNQTICTPGNYNLTATVRDKVGCITTAPVNFIINSSPGVSAGPDVILCGTPNPTTIYATIGTPATCGKGNPKSYSWSPTSYLSAPTGCYTKAYPPTTTVYTLTSTDLVTGCVSVDQVTVNVMAPPCNGDVGRMEDGTASGSEEIVFPNPNDGTFTFRYDLDEASVGYFDLFDLAGQLVARYDLPAGSNTLNVNQDALPSGIYFYKLMVNGQLIRTEKLSIVK